MENLVPHYLKYSEQYSVIITDLRGNYAYVNSLFQKKFNFLTENFIGKESLSLAVHPEETEIIGNAVKECFQSPEKVVKIHLRKPDNAGDYYWTSWDLSAFFNETKELIGIICIGHDISESEKLRIQNKRYTEEIEEKNIILEKQNKILQEIAWKESHEIRKPIANILGLINLITMNDEERKQYVQSLEDVTKDLDGVIKEIVDKTHIKKD
ncbi:MAG: PAS domain S-box protein [Raineya sp.]|nr:PAS domain S-box protein [Raineya sp.]